MIKIKSKYYKIFSLFVLLTISVNLCKADAGRAFRYKVILELKASAPITGYVYHYTYGEKFDPNKSSFSDYFKENFNDEKVIYKEIKTVEVNENFAIDLALTHKNQLFVESDIQNISLLEELEIPVGDRIFVLENPLEYFLFENKPIHKEIVRNQSMENCRIILFSWSRDRNMLKLKDKIGMEIENLHRDKSVNFNENLNTYFKGLKDELFKKQIFMIQYCEAL